jgi:hypothetical protein
MSVWKAAQWDKLQNAATLDAKKVRKLPKLVPGGARRQEVPPNVRKAREAMQRLRKTGDVRDAAAYFEEVL